MALYKFRIIIYCY